MKRNDPIGHGRRMTIVGNGKSHELIDSIKQFNGVDVEWYVTFVWWWWWWS